MTPVAAAPGTFPQPSMPATIDPASYYEVTLIRPIPLPGGKQIAPGAHTEMLGTLVTQFIDSIASAAIVAKSNFIKPPKAPNP